MKSHRELGEPKWTAHQNHYSIQDFKRRYLETSIDDDVDDDVDDNGEEKSRVTLPLLTVNIGAVASDKNMAIKHNPPSYENSRPSLDRVSPRSRQPMIEISPVSSNAQLSTHKDLSMYYSSGASVASSRNGLPKRHYYLPRTVSYDNTPFSSTTSSLTSICRICHLPSDVDKNLLISPCRCDGSMKYVHGVCLRKWIEVCTQKRIYTGPAYCELCGYFYRKRRYIKCKNWHCPKVSACDKLLHTLFFLSLIIMVGCAITTILCFVNGGKQFAKYKIFDEESAVLTREEIITLSCGIGFFVCFFMAIAVEIKSKHTIYQVMRRCLRYNTVWVIENYIKEEDYELVYKRHTNV